MTDRDQNTIENPIELRSQEIDAILGRTPNSLVRNGITVICVVMLLILSGIFFFSYPDTIHCRVVITASNPPIHLIAQKSGYIHHLLVADRQKVDANQLLAVLENPADPKDIQILETWIDSMIKEGIGISEKFSNDHRFKLGEITPYYLEFRKELNEYHNNNNKSQLTYNIYHALDELNYQLTLWKMKYTIRSPIEGTVSLGNVWANNQSIIIGEVVMSIVPLDQGKVIGRMEIPAAGLGKIKKGQEVIIKLDNYPFTEFGVIKGIITSISLVPVNGIYIAIIELPNGLQSNYGNSLIFNQEMGGTANIIIEELSLFERFLHPVRSAINRK